MEQQLKELEQKIMNVYDKIKKEIPYLRRLTFEVQEFSTNTRIWGCYHIYDQCGIYNDINEVYDLICKHQILFQKFDHIKRELQ